METAGRDARSLIVEPDGKASNIRIVRPPGMGLNEQAIGVVMLWRFRPGTRCGKPIRVSAQVNVNFQLSLVMASSRAAGVSV